MARALTFVVLYLVCVNLISFIFGFVAVYFHFRSYPSREPVIETIICISLAITVAALGTRTIYRRPAAKDSN
jgi:threonine/homoserine/homoserine lactone efflux protein